MVKWEIFKAISMQPLEVDVTASGDCGERFPSGSFSRRRRHQIPGSCASQNDAAGSLGFGWSSQCVPVPTSIRTMRQEPLTNQAKEWLPRSMLLTIMKWRIWLERSKQEICSRAIGGSVSHSGQVKYRRSRNEFTNIKEIDYLKNIKIAMSSKD